MANLNILICGGGCAGPSLAFWLVRSGHKVTIIERHPALRAQGAQIDLRAQGIDVVKRMGLLEVIRSKLVDEAGVAMVDSENRIKALMLANTSGKGAQTGTSEYEIMRGDLVRILYDATKNDVEYIFGKTVESFEQDDQGVTVHLSTGETGRYDILVGADGQGSRIRKAILPADAPDPLRHLGLYIAYWTMPREPVDNNIRKVYHAPGARMAMSRTHSPTESQGYFFTRDDSKEMQSMPRASVEKQKEFWMQKFEGVGWQIPRFMEGMKTTENFYCQEVVQVKTDTWYKGRVVLLADAAHCPSPFTAMGTTSAFVGAYVLAGEIERHSDDIPKAFAEYERVLRPFVNEFQKISTTFLKLALPETSWGIWVLYFLAGLFGPLLHILAQWMPKEKGGWAVPDYPENKLVR